MKKIHGIIACAGNGTRFAESVGKQSPYPKHLEMLGRKSILTRVFEALIHNISVSSVTFTLNPLLQEDYIYHLQQLQSFYPNTTFTYALAKEVLGGRLFTNIKETVKEGVYQFDGQRIDLGNPIVAIALGDSVITPGNKELIDKDIATFWQDIMEGKSFAVFRDIHLKGLIYWISKVSTLEEGDPHFRRGAHEYRLKWWNCNTREELYIAGKELGYYPVENELNAFRPRRGKEG